MRHFLRNPLDYVPRRVDDDCLQELRRCMTGATLEAPRSRRSQGGVARGCHLGHLGLDHVVLAQGLAGAARDLVARAPRSTRPSRIMWEDAERDGEFAPERHWQLRLAATWAIQQARDVVASVYNAAALPRSSTRPVRAPPARHPRRNPARPRPPGPFRNRRPGSCSACHPRGGCSDNCREAR